MSPWWQGAVLGTGTWGDEDSSGQGMNAVFESTEEAMTLGGAREKLRLHKGGDI